MHGGGTWNYRRDITRIIYLGLVNRYPEVQASGKGIPVSYLCMYKQGGIARNR
jgi:hypothetical protein